MEELSKVDVDHLFKPQNHLLGFELKKKYDSISLFIVLSRLHLVSWRVFLLVFTISLTTDISA